MPERAAPSRRRRRRFQFLPVFVGGWTLLIFGVVIVLASRNLRQTIRYHIAKEKVEVLHEIASWQLSEVAKEMETEGSVTNPANQAALLLEISRLPQLKDAMAWRLFTPAGSFNAAPGHVTEAALDPEDFRQLKDLKPISHFYPRARLSDHFLLSPEPRDHPRTVPLLEVLLPLHQANDRNLLGIGQYLLEGDSLAAEFRLLDRNLLLEASFAFLVGGITIVGVLGWAFQRLQRSHRLLAQRSSELLRANHDLTLAAKTSALGAVTAHLIHGLKNPLFGLQNFVANRGIEKLDEADPDWQLALSSTKRMQSLINEVVRVLKEEDGAAGYQVSLAELVEIITSKMAQSAVGAGVQLRTDVQAEGTLANREANLIILILDLLIQNAIQATPAGKSVTLSLRSVSNKVVCEVNDEGPGLPEEVRSTLFTPCKSSKEGGSGLGLTISKQLANHLGAELEIKSTTPAGTTFALTLPARLLTR